MTVRTGRLCHSLRAARIASITLCEHHVTGCVELIVNHTRKGDPPLRIQDTEHCDDGVFTLTCSKGDSTRFIDLRLEGVPKRITRLLADGHHYSSMHKDQEQILFVPRPKTDKQHARVGCVIASTS